MKVSIILNEVFLKMAEIVSPAEMGSRFEEILDKYGHLEVDTTSPQKGSQEKEFKTFKSTLSEEAIEEIENDPTAPHNISKELCDRINETHKAVDKAWTK